MTGGKPQDPAEPPSQVPDETPTCFLQPGSRESMPGDASPTRTLPSVPGYGIVRMLGRGGMGTVYLATDLRLGRPVALKVVNGGDQEHTRTLLREAKAQARIDHPNVCKVYEAGTAEEGSYIAMQFLEGQTLDLAARTLPRETRIRLMITVAEAIQAAHVEGLIHRDLKPANVMVVAGPDDQPWPFVMDFGLAQDQLGIRLTQVGTILGTPAYMAPEQACGDLVAIDRRTDVYALGATLYELLVGHLPFEGGGMAQTLSRILEEEPTPPKRHDPGLPEDLNAIVLKCLEKDPRQRYATARELAEDLRAFLAGDPVRARTVRLAGRLLRKARRHRLVSALGLMALAALLTAAGVALRSRSQAAAAGELGRSLGTQLARAESVLRYGHLLPAHPIAREERLLTEMAEEVKGRIPGAKGLPKAMLHVTLGQIHLLLGKRPEAKREIETARDLGLRDSRLDLALAEVYLDLYTEARLENARTMTGEGLRQADLKARRDLLEPAAVMLGSQPSPRLRMRLAFALERPEEGERLKQESLEREPWLYEVLIDAAKVHVQEADRRYSERDFGTALQTMEKAWTELEKARALAPSDPAIPSVGSDVAYRARVVFSSQNKPVDPEWARRGRDALERLGKVSPNDDLVRFVQAKSEVGRLENLADFQPITVSDLEKPRIVLATLTDHPKIGIEACFLNARLRDFQVQLRTLHGEPVDDLVRDLAALTEAALRKFPGVLDLQLQFGGARRNLAELDSRTGRDPRAHLDEAIGTYRKALESHPGHFYVQLSLALALTDRADADLRRGAQGMPFLGEARSILLKLEAQAPADLDVATGLVNLNVTEILQAVRQKKEPRLPLQEATRRLARLKARGFTELRLIPLQKRVSDALKTSEKGA